MNPSRTILVGALLMLGASACTERAAPSSPVEPAELVLINGGIYTVDAAQSIVEAAAIRDGVFVAVGSNAEVNALIGPDTRVIDLSGRLALPGFHDAHVHPAESGIEMLQCPLSEQATIEAIQAELAACAGRTEGEWIIGSGWNLSLFPEGNADKRLIDAVVADRPVFLLGADGHSAWVNSRALALAGIDAETPDPPQGVIERDRVSGEPTGTLRESAQELVQRLLPPPDPATRLAGLREGLRRANAVGITSLIEASATEHELAAYKALADAGELSANVVVSITYGLWGSPDFERLLKQRADYAAPPRLRTDAVKIFLDGVLEGETAALLEPYLDRPEHRGALTIPAPDLAAAVTRFDAMGLQVHMHAIGDAAVRAGLDAVEAARQSNGAGDGRHHIAHLQLIHPDDIPRFAALSVAANFQALWAYPDEYITDINLPQVGPERVARMYPIGSVVRAGGLIVGGSDWSVSSIDPLDAIQMAVLRQDPTGERPGILNERERVDLATMIEAYTINGAWLMHQQTRTGSIEVGKAADLVVLDRDIFALPPRDIASAEVQLTLLDGEPVYPSDAFRPATRQSTH